MSRRIAKWTLILILPPLFLVVCVYIYYVLGVYAFHGGFDPPHSTDAELLATFEDQRSILDELVTMFREDERLIVVAPNWTTPENFQDFGISMERITGYRRLLAHIGPQADIRSSNKGQTIRIFVNPRGSMFGGTIRGFYYSENPPEGTVHEDGWYRQTVAGDRIALKPIEDNWYLYDYAGGS